jgi:hypothetical protein
MMARCYYDLADYNRDGFFSPMYNNYANAYIDSALVLFPQHPMSTITIRVCSRSGTVIWMRLPGI